MVGKPTTQRRGTIRRLLYRLMPSYCVSCDEPLPLERRHICEECFDRLPRYLGSESYYMAQERLEGLVPFTEYRSDLVFTKTNTVRKLIHLIKYRQQPELGYDLAHHFAPIHVERGHFEDVTALVPIPLVPQRHKARGYNQSEFIARGLADVLGLPVEGHLLKRHSVRGTQTHRTGEARWKAMEGQFYVPDGVDVTGRRLLIVDDVLTTGATLTNAARALYQSGAESVSFYTLSTDSLFL